MFKVNRMKKNGVTIEGKIANYIPQYKINNALNSAYQNAGYREKSVLDDIKSIELNSHVCPGDRYITADIHNSADEGIQIIVFHETDRKNGYKPGDITG